ncbi:isopeptide-forming domain-containing fimbrial protein [Varibaculum cambriense]|uniref:isopeptide-forming domain-containing fimbrial protein n=1 Tax=Varibaculum cambriense TaxID=184870 RepID=UPI00290FCB00|nr:isopeptide-forming domain-containing fimbrial protein [Varibaculum cambriense]MDU3273934.1 isopeptide-forming domain-containing fimbrial protein [Varibaculum cambriense]
MNRKAANLCMIGVIVSLILGMMLLSPLAQAAGEDEDAAALYATIYTRANCTDLEIQEGTGWFPDYYEIEDADVTSEKTLENGLRKCEIEFALEAADYPVGKEITFSVKKGFSQVGESVKVKVAAGSDGTPEMRMIFKEKISKRFAVTMSDETGAAIPGAAESFELPLYNTVSQKNETVTVRKDSAGHGFLKAVAYDDSGKFAPSSLIPAAQADLPTVTLQDGGQKSVYAVKKMLAKNDGFELVLKQVKLVDQTYHVTIKRPLEVLAESDTWKFNIGGKADPQAEKQLSLPTASGDYSFDIKASGVPEGAKLSLPILPQAYVYYGIAGQEFDSATNTLTVTLGKKVYILASNIESVKYDSFATAYAKDGFTLGLYDQGGNLVAKSTATTAALGYPASLFKAVTPGEYTVRIEDAAPVFKNDYDLSLKYGVSLAENGRLTMKMLRSGSDEEVWANPYGGTDDRFKDDARSRALIGYKTPLLLLVPKKPSFDKVIDQAKYPIGEDGKKAYASRGDLIDYRINAKIPGDHRLVVSYGKYVDTGFKNTVTVVDKLDERLELVTGSLKVMEGETVATDFEARYNPDTREIRLLDQAKAQVAEFDFLKAIKIPAERKLSIKFQVKLKKVGEQPIYNRIPDSETAIIPYLDLLVKKHWEGGLDLLKDIDMRDYIDNFEVETWQGKNKIATEPVRKYLKAGSFQQGEDKDFQFSLEKLPKYTPADVEKKPEERVALTYKVTENLPAELTGKFKVSQVAQAEQNDGVNLVFFTNTFIPPTPPVTPPTTPPVTPPKVPPTTPPVPEEIGDTGSGAASLLGICALGVALGGAIILRRRYR